MGLTAQSTGTASLREMQDIRFSSSADIIAALAGNPNTGKSTVFNSLTGLKQHTGNWTGKTVACAQGFFKFNDKSFILVDLPGTYSLLSNSMEEEVARNFICFSNPNVTIVVVDATCLERNLNLVLQILEMTGQVVVCVNLMDEARRKKITINLKRLSELLGVPVVGTSARSGTGLNELMEAVYKVSLGEITTSPIKPQYDPAIENLIQVIQERIRSRVGQKLDARWVSLKLLDRDKDILDSIDSFLGNEETNLGTNLGTFLETIENQGTFLDFSDQNQLRDSIVSAIVKLANDISRQVVCIENKKYRELDRKIDNILTSKKFGIPTMILLLAVIFWITLRGANIPSGIIMDFLFGIQDKLTAFFTTNNLPDWLHGALVLGVYRTLAWVISVMLPPMAIFFPLFTLLEDLGYLPRVAFNLDNFFKKACAHGKQALTMCMGFGCNAAGVVGCRIIDSPRERLIAIITNNFVPCNGRFPTLITIASIFIAGVGTEKEVSAEATMAGSILQGFIGTAVITCVIILGVITTLFASRILSKTILKGQPSSFTLELPPFRKPQIGRVLVRSMLDRTLFVLGRAVSVAAPAGLFIWLMANIDINGISLLNYGAGFLQPFAELLGLDGIILMAFILGLPANEIIMPIILMSYMSTGSMIKMDNPAELSAIFTAHSWTWLTCVNTMLLSLMHFPCATTLLTIKKETNSWKWTITSFIVPTMAGIIITFVVAQIARLLGSG